MAEQPALNRFYVASYAANDRDFPIVAVRLDPRVAGYRVPEDLSPHPDSKRYPNHVFTGSQPSNGDERVTHIYEILPSPWVPFTRYDDDLGPIQGRRRSVKNEGQVASLAADKRTTYEAREGSAIVYTEIEETWSIETDDDGNSLFPIRDRDFYDPSRGPVQERRQLFVPTGEEEGSLENVNGVITQTSYEPYNEFLSVKIVQTYSVNGPQLIGKATDNDGQLVTVTTQRKGADGYVPPNPTATRTVEVSREDAESLVERVVDTPEIFTAKTFSLERPDPIPQKFRVAVPLQSEQEVVAGEAELPTLLTGEISRTEEQRNKFLKRTTATSRDQTVLPKTLTQKATNNERQEVTITETLQLGDTDEVPTATKTVESEALGDGNFVVRKTEVPSVFTGKTIQKTRIDLTPEKFKAKQEDTTTEENVAGVVDPAITLDVGQFRKSEEQVTEFVKRISTTSRDTTSTQTLSESLITAQGQIATRTLNLVVVDPNNPPTLTPDALTVDASIEALGDGRAVISNTKVGSVFANKTVQKTRADLTPQKFRAAQEDTTIQETVAGTVDPDVVLDTGEFAKSEEQVTEFVKRTSTTSRDVAEATELNELVVLPDQSIGTRSLVLAKKEDLRDEDGNIVLEGSAELVDGSIEELGDGRLVKTQVTSPVFNEALSSAERPINIPARFLANKNITVTSSVAAGTDTSLDTGEVDENGNPLPILGGSTIARQKQRISAFKVKTTTTSQDLGSFSTLRGYDYDEAFGITIPFKEYISSSRPLPSITAEVDPLGDNKFLVKEYEDITTTNSSLDSIKLSFPSRGTITGVPPVLKKLEVEWQVSSGDGEFSSTGTATSEGNTGSIGGNGSGRASGNGAVIPIWVTEFEEVNTTNIPTTAYFFFLKYNSQGAITESDIRGKIGEVKQWPIFKPKSYTLSATGQRIRLSMDVDFTFNRNYASESTSSSSTSGKGTNQDIDNIIETINIRPCIHADLSQDETKEQDVKASASASISIAGSTITVPTEGVVGLGLPAEGSVNFDLAATSPSDIPRTGKYLIDYRVEPYKFGYARVYAEVVDASIFAISQAEE